MNRLVLLTTLTLSISNALHLQDRLNDSPDITVVDMNKLLDEIRGTSNDFRGLPDDFKEPLDEFRGPSDSVREPSDEFRGPPDDFRGPSGEIRGPSDEFREASDEFRGPSDEVRRLSEDFREPPDDSKRPSLDDVMDPSLPSVQSEMKNDDARDMTEAEINQQYGIMDDMILPKHTKRGIPFSASRWPRTTGGKLRIPYIINKNIQGAERKLIISAINTMNGHMKRCNNDDSNVWISRTSERYYILFQLSTGRCASKIGYTGRAAQPIFLGSKCFSLGIILHEMLHAMGFLHEQSRPDRDTYIRVLTKNILPKYLSQFRLVSFQRTAGTPYDYFSVMHYDGTAGIKNTTKDLLLSMIRRDHKFIRAQRKYMTAWDVFELRTFYQCTPNQRPFRAAVSALSLGECDFDGGIRRCSGFSSKNWTEIDTGVVGNRCENKLKRYCPYLKNIGLCGTSNLFYVAMKIYCEKECGLCTPTAGGIQLVNQNNGAYILFNTYLNYFNEQAFRSCACNSVGVCGTVKFCVKFYFKMPGNSVTTATSLRVFGITVQPYILPTNSISRIKRFRYSPVYVPSGYNNGIMNAELTMQCAFSSNFIIQSGTSQPIIVDNMFVKAGSC